VTSSPGRTEPPLRAGEATTLRAFLDYHRDTLRWKTSGLSAAQLDTPLAPSPMTLGGLVKHLAYVESNWCSVVLAGHDPLPPFDTADWGQDRDWDWHSAATDSPEELRGTYDRTVAAADRLLDAALARDGLETLSAREDRHGGGRFTVRWILTHLVEEYARHNGHADLLRESIDGSTVE